MGLQRDITFPADVPEWPAILAALAANGEAVQMRMIDGELSFPEEEPVGDWKELRVAARGAMVSIRRTAAGVSLVVWGNADAEQLRLRDALEAAYVAAGGEAKC